MDIVCGRQKIWHLTNQYTKIDMKIRFRKKQTKPPNNNNQKNPQKQQQQKKKRKPHQTFECSIIGYFYLLNVNN